MVVDAQKQSFTPSERPLSDSERCELAAYNAAFEQLGFSWRWSDADYQALLDLPDAHARVEHYIRDRHSHLLCAYDPHALAALIEERKRECEGGAARADDRSHNFDPEFRPL